MRALKFLILAPVLLAACAVPALAVQVRPHYSVDIQAVYDQNGNPSLVANFAPNGALATPRWSICPPPNSSTCTPASSTSQELTPGPTRAGTVFQASAVYMGTTYTGISAVWEGQLHAVRAPTLKGEPRVGARVSPTVATWQGGWQTQLNYQRPQDGAQSGGRAPAIDQLRVEACRTRKGTHCLNLSQVTSAGSSNGSAVRIGRRFKGWYLFALDQRFSGDAAFATPAYRSPEDAPTLKVGPTVARSAAYGPVS
jgi:hypothetical protein